MIRPATKADNQAVYVLMCQLSQHHFTPEQFFACYDFTITNHIILLCEQEGHICGCGVMNIHYPLHYSQKVAEIVNLIVGVGMRGQGIGSHLLLELEKIALQNNCVSIELDTSKWREDAHRFYEREGYKKTHYKLTKSLLTD